MQHVSHLVVFHLLCMNYEFHLITMFASSGKLQSPPITYRPSESLGGYYQPPYRTSSWTQGIEGQHFPFMNLDGQFSADPALVHHGARSMSDASVSTLTDQRKNETNSKPRKEVESRI